LGVAYKWRSYADMCQCLLQHVILNSIQDLYENEIADRVHIDDGWGLPYKKTISLHDNNAKAEKQERVFFM
jgi:hypothetical protein